MIGWGSFGWVWNIQSSQPQPFYHPPPSIFNSTQSLILSHNPSLCIISWCVVLFAWWDSKRKYKCGYVWVKLRKWQENIMTICWMIIDWFHLVFSFDTTLMYIFMSSKMNARSDLNWREFYVLCFDDDDDDDEGEDGWWGCWSEGWLKRVGWILLSQAFIIRFSHHSHLCYHDNYHYYDTKHKTGEIQTLVPWRTR